MLKKTSGLVTLGGILSAVGTSFVGIPIATITYYAQIAKTGPPGWFNASMLPMILLGFVLGAVGQAIVGVAGKGADDVPTLPQVQASTKQAEVNQAAADANAAANPAPPAKVLVEPKP